MGFYRISNSQLGSNVKSMSLRKREEFDKKIIGSIAASIVLIVLPFLPLWQWGFKFENSQYFDTNEIYTALRYSGPMWQWVFGIIIGGIGMLGLLFFKPKEEREKRRFYNNIFNFFIILTLISLATGLLLTNGLWGIAKMVTAPGLWISLFCVIVIALSQLSQETWGKLRRDALAYVLVFPTVFLMLFVFYIPIFLNFFLSFQNFYDRQASRFVLENLPIQSVGFDNYLTILLPVANTSGEIATGLIFVIILITLSIAASVYVNNDKWSAKKKAIVGGVLFFGIAFIVAIFQSIQWFIIDNQLNISFNSENIDVLYLLILLILATGWVLLTYFTFRSVNDTFKRWAGYLLTIVPLVVMLWLSDLFLGSYSALSSNDVFYIAYLVPTPLEVLQNTFYWTFTCVLAHILIGLVLALLMNHTFRFRSIIRGLLIVPWAIPSFITITILGIFVIWEDLAADSIFNIFHLVPYNWYQSSNFLTSAIIVNIYLGYSFIMVALLAALQSVNQELYEAAQIDGASAWQRFRNITLPLIKPVIVVTSILGFMWTFNMFNVIYLLSRPKSEILRPEDYVILVVYVFNLFQNASSQNWSHSATISFLLFILLIIMTKAYTKITGKGPYDVD